MDGRITQPELQRMLSLTSIELDGFLKSHCIYEDVTLGVSSAMSPIGEACLGA